MIAYSFPPEGNAGTYRPLRFARYLPSMDWLPTVVSADTNSYERYDPGLLAMVPKEVEVIRVRSRDWWQAFRASRAQRIQEKIAQAPLEVVARIQEAHHAPVRSFIRELVSKAEAWCYHPDKAMLWIRAAVEATVKVCRSKRPNVIWATGQPWSSFIVASRASKRTGVPYVIDFRGSWTLVPTASICSRPHWAQRVDRRVLANLFERAQGAIFFSEVEAECFWCAYKGALDSSKIYIIPNGFDGEIEELPPPDGDKCMILYTGTLGLHRYDTLLQALLHLKKCHPALADRLRLMFFSDAVEALTQQVAALGLSDIVKTSGTIANAEITRLNRNAHAFLMLGIASNVKGNETIVGSKLFSYLKAGRPIVGVLPPGEAKTILQRVGVFTIADADSLEDIVDVLRRLLDAWSMGTLSSLAPNCIASEAYSAKRQTAALIRALEGLPAAEPFVPGSVEIPPSMREIIIQHESMGAEKVRRLQPV
jgi:Glycosyl transferase 4-like domain